MNRLFEEQTIKALECCINDDCDNCPDSFGNCEHNAMKNALNLINFYNEKIKNMQEEIDRFQRLDETALRLIEENREFSRQKLELLREIQKGVLSNDEIVKGFQKKLKEAFPESDRNNISPAIYYDDYCDIIDEIANEFIKE